MDARSNTLMVGIVSEKDPTSNDPVTRLLKRMQKFAREASRVHPATVSLQYIIYVPGPLVGVGFEGVRRGAFLGSRKQLNILIAIPKQLDDGLADFLIRAVEEGWEIADRYFERKRMGEALLPLALAKDEFVRSLRQNSQAI